MSRTADRRAGPDLLDAVRACYGGLLLAAPRRALSMCTPAEASPRALGVARVLGARHLVQAMLTAAVLSAAGPPDEIPPSTALLAGSAVDTAHAASMFWLALAHRRLRRAAMADALLAGSLAAFGAVTARQLRR